MSYALLFPMNFLTYGFLIRRFYPRLRFNKPSQDLRDAFVSMARQVNRKVAYDSLSELIRNYDIRTTVSAIRVPTLIVRGEKDPGMPRAVQYLNKAIASSELRVIPKGGHEVMVDKPQEFNKILNEFLLKTA